MRKGISMGEVSRNLNRPVWVKGLGLWMLVLHVVALGSGCNTVEEPAWAKTPTVRAEAPAPVVDDSWEIQEYQRRGVSDPLRRWSADDYRNCRDVLAGLSVSNRSSLPRLDSDKSGPLFRRLVNTTNLLSLEATNLPSNERIRDFFGILNRIPVFIDLYRYDTREPVFHREFIELSHGFLQMLGSAVHWDGRKLPLAPGETEAVTFQLNEYSRTRLDNLLKVSPSDSQVPQGQRFIVVGSYAVTTLRSLLPWLADGSGQSGSDRLHAARYLRNDMPALWPHVSASQQTEALSEINELIRRTSNAALSKELSDLRGALMTASGGD